MSHYIPGEEKAKKIGIFPAWKKKRLQGFGLPVTEGSQQGRWKGTFCNGK